MSFRPTEEQARAQELFLTGRSLTIEALAGSGKTTTLKHLAGAAPNKRMLYTSFAASVVRDAKAAFPRHVRASTNHGLAFGPVGAAYLNAGRLGNDAPRLTPRLLMTHFGWSSGTFGGVMFPDDGTRYVMETLTGFCQSADPDLSIDHVPFPETSGTTGAAAVEAARPLILHAARKVWEAWVDPNSRLPITHDTYLKLFALRDPQLGYDICLLDEAQDTNPLMIGLLLAQKNTQLVIVGDQYQQIYSWRGAVNALRSFGIADTCQLTQSFRFGPAIAEAANAVLAGHLGSSTRVRGFAGVESRLAKLDAAPVLLARKNATLIGEIVSTLERKPSARIAVIGGVDDLIRMVEGADALQRNERPKRCPELTEFADWPEVERYAQTRLGRELQVLVQLVTEHGTQNLRRTLDQVRGHERDAGNADLILSTGHKSKGLEWPAVRLADDFKVPPPEDASEAEIREAGWNPEEANLLYVAVTRARQVLDVTTCSAWRDAEQRCAQGAAAATLPGVPTEAELQAAAHQDLDALADVVRHVAASMAIEPHQVLDVLKDEYFTLAPTLEPSP